MTLELFSSWITLGMVIIIFGMQMQNAFKFGLRNGAGKTRLLLISSVACTGLHVWVHWNETMWWMTAAIFLFGIVYIRSK